MARRSSSSATRSIRSPSRIWSSVSRCAKSSFIPTVPSPELVGPVAASLVQNMRKCCSAMVDSVRDGVASSRYRLRRTSSSSHSPSGERLAPQLDPAGQALRPACAPSCRASGRRFPSRDARHPSRRRIARSARLLACRASSPSCSSRTVDKRNDRREHGESAVDRVGHLARRYQCGSPRLCDGEHRTSAARASGARR